MGVCHTAMEMLEILLHTTVTMDTSWKEIHPVSVNIQSDGVVHNETAFVSISINFTESVNDCCCDYCVSLSYVISITMA